MSKQDETLSKAYSNVPKEVNFYILFDWIFEFRSIKYYYFKLIRFFTR